MAKHPKPVPRVEDQHRRIAKEFPFPPFRQTSSGGICTIEIDGQVHTWNGRELPWLMPLLNDLLGRLWGASGVAGQHLKVIDGAKKRKPQFHQYQKDAIDLLSPGMSWKAMSRELAKQGIKVSDKTIAAYVRSKPLASPQDSVLGAQSIPSRIYRAAHGVIMQDEVVVYTLDEFRATYKAGRSKALEAIKKGDLIVSRSGRRILISKQRADEWLRSLEQPAKAA